MAVPGGPVGVIFGDIASTHFDIAVSDATLKRLDYVEAEHQGARVLGLVEKVVRQSNVSYEMAMSGGGHEGIERLTASVNVIGHKDSRGRVVVPRTPFAAGSTVRLADDEIVTAVLGLEGGRKGAYLGHVKGLEVEVRLNLNTLAQKHLSVLAKTGAGKSYTVGVILEEFLLAKVPLVILDPHGEYGSLRHPNINDKELDQMMRFGVKPKQFQSQIQEYAIDTQLNPQAEPLRLEGINLEAREIVDMLPTKLSGGQVGVLYQAVKDVQDHLPSYTLRDIMDAVGVNKSNAKWNVLNALEALESTGLFHIKGTPVRDIVKAGKCTIINLKGVGPDIQEVVAARLTAMLWAERKRDRIPPHILVVEEAHNFCPERGVGNAVSGPVLRTVAAEGRKFGLGLVIVSQRPAKIDKNVLSQCNTQVVLKVTNPNDIKAIVSSVEGITSEAADEIQRLTVGSCLVAGGGLTEPVFVDVRPRVTRHGGESIDILAAQKKRPEPVVEFVAEEPEPAPRPVRRTPRSPEPEPPAMEDPVERGVQSAMGRARQAAPPRVEMSHQTVMDANALAAAHRVARRVGVVGGEDPNRTAMVLRDTALRQKHHPDHFLRIYAEMGATTCLEGTPACIRCPLRDQCVHHRDAQEERHKRRGGIRRLWGG